MRTLSVREAREALTTLEEILERDGELVVTRRGKPIARLVAATPTKRPPTHDDLRALTPLLRRKSEDLVREDRDAR